MTADTLPFVRLTVEDFLVDSQGAKYSDVARTHREALARLMAMLSDPNHQAELVAAEEYGHPALSGIVRAIEADESIARSLASPAGNRFRQAVGVAVRIAMERLGWGKTGRKGPVRGATKFKRAERYEPPRRADTSTSPRDRARAALEVVELIGDEEERTQTASDIMLALAQTRRAENRPF